MTDPAHTFPNPLVPGFNPDPSCVRVDGVYYLVTSSFEYLPGLPLYRSRDFASWEHVGNVATREEQLGVREVPSGMGAWAPTIRHHNGLFHVVVTITGSPRGCVVFTATDPADRWSNGVSLQGLNGIDPDLAWDDDGVAVVTYSALVLDGPDSAHHGIQQSRFDLTTGRALEKPRSLWSGTGMQFPEAPHVFNRGDHWYLMIAEGGTERGHCVSVARGPTIEGPFHGAPHNPLLSARSTRRPVQNTGHADIVAGPDGNDVLVLLGLRPLGSTVSFSPLGRETFTTPVSWIDGWPHAKPVELSPRTESVDEAFDFHDESTLDDPGWLAVRRAPKDVASLTETPGRLTMHGVEGGMNALHPAFVGRRQRNIASTFAVRVDATDGAGGLALRYSEAFTITLVARASASGSTITATATLSSIVHHWSVDVNTREPELRISTDYPSTSSASIEDTGGDRIRLLVVDADRAEHELANVDGRFWTAETATSFVGRVTGLFAQEGTVRFARLTYHGEDRG